MDRNQTRHGISRAAVKACRAHVASLTGQTAVQVFFRFAAYFCLGCVLYREEGKSLWAAAFALTMLLAILPFRFLYGEKLRIYADASGLPGPEGIPYFVWLRAGIMRLLRGLVWGLPFLAGLGYFLWAMENVPFNELGLTFQRIAALWPFHAEGGETTRGILLYFSVLLLFLLLFAYGWRRDIAMEYLPESRAELKSLLDKNRSVWKKARISLARVTAGNLLLSLPALLLLALILIPYAKENLRVSENPLMTVRNLKKLMMRPLPAKTSVLLTADLMFFYLPLCVLRKMRNCVLVHRILHENTSREE